MSKNLQLWTLIFQTLILAATLVSSYLLFAKHRDPKIYWSLGKNIAAVYVIIEVLLLLSWNAINAAIVMGLLHFLSIGLALMCGFRLLRILKLPAFIFLSPSSHSKKWRKKFSLGKFFTVSILSAVFICVFTYILFKFTNPQVAPFLKEAPSTLSSSALSSIPKSVGLFFLCVAFYEEIIFRIFFQSVFRYLFRKISHAGPWAILATSALFAVGHFGILETWWIKLTQTFVIGLVLGALMNTYGFEASFLAQAILNIFELYASKYFLPQMS